MKRTILKITLLLLLPFITRAQQITSGEYFIDTDPGVAAGIALPAFTSADSINQTISLHTSGLGYGFHRVYYRYKYGNGSWGIPEDRLFFLTDTAHSVIVTQPKIAKGEYFVDTDPGRGKGTALPSFASADSVNQTINFNTTGLSVGFHCIYYRYADLSGKSGFTH